MVYFVLARLMPLNVILAHPAYYYEDCQGNGSLEGRQMGKSPDYSALVGEAEKAVQNVKDPELKRIAFQKVLEELMGGRKAQSERLPKRGRAAKSARAKASRGGPRTYIREMIDEGFFKKPKALPDVKAELENRGHHIPLTSLSGPLQQLCKSKELRRQKTEGRFVYSNW